MNPTVIVLSVLPPSVNNLFPGNNNKRRYPSAEYVSWRTRAGWELVSQKPRPVVGPVELYFQFGKTDGRRSDVSNLVKAPEDLLVTHGIIDGDDQRFVRRVIAEWSEDLSGVIITITPFQKAVAPRGEVLAQPGSLR